MSNSDSINKNDSDSTIKEDLDTLVSLLKESGATVTFDPYRDITKGKENL